jgi:hypothetical protein
MITELQQPGRQQPVRRRRARRSAAGWLRVAVAEAGLERTTIGRLIDTSKGGLGLVLDRSLSPGTRVYVTRCGEEERDPQAWEQREARVVHATELRDGTCRVGLAFRPEPPSALQMWATRALLLGVAAVAAIQGLALDRSATIATLVVAAIALALEIASEWNYWREGRHYQELIRDWEAAEEPEAPSSQSFVPSQVA